MCCLRKDYLSQHKLWGLLKVMRIGIEQHEFYYCLQFIFKNLIHLHSCRTQDIHVDFDELQPALPGLKSLGMLQICWTLCSTYCPNQLFEGATPTTVFAFSSLQAIIAKQELNGYFLSFSISEDSRFHSDPEEQIWAHKKISIFWLPHLGAWPLARKRNKSVQDFSRSAGK